MKSFLIFVFHIIDFISNGGISCVEENVVEIMECVNENKKLGSFDNAHMLALKYDEVTCSRPNVAYRCVLNAFDKCKSSVPKEIFTNLVNIKSDSNAVHMCKKFVLPTTIEDNNV